jgi:hypothetical protein
MEREKDDCGCTNTCMHELPEPMFLEKHMKEARKVITRTLTKTLLASDLCDRGAELLLESLCSGFAAQGK